MIALLEAKRAGLFGRAHVANNIIAGLVVGVVALPLAMAFAIASGAKPEQGIYTAIIAGFLGSVCGGSRLQVSGPTGAFIVILAAITAKHGIDGLQIATFMAGLMLVALGAARLGTVIKYIPHPVIIGFTSGIAVIIWVGQWKDFFGLHAAPNAAHFHDKLASLLVALPDFHPVTSALALLALLLTIYSPKLFKHIPGPLVAMVVITVIQSAFQFPGVATIGSAFGGIPQALPTFQLPQVSATELVQLIGPAFTIALLGAIESLLSAVVADGMAGGLASGIAPPRHDPNQELIGQGIANITAPLFGGFAATGAIARTATNIRNGATSPLAGITHAVLLLLVILLCAPLADHIPLCALSAILFVVAWNMAELHHFWHLARTAPRSDVIILLITFGLTVLTDIVIAVNVGVILSSLIFMRRMAQAVEIQDETGEHEWLMPPSANNGQRMIYSIDGPFFFGAAEKLQSTLASTQQHVEAVVLRLGRVPFIDASGLEALSELVNNFQAAHTHVALCEVRANVLSKIARSGIADRVGRENIHDSLSDWIAANTPQKAGSDSVVT